jgi:hypothetical protein
MPNPTHPATFTYHTYCPMRYQYHTGKRVELDSDQSTAMLGYNGNVAATASMFKPTEIASAAEQVAMLQLSGDR